MIKPQRIDLSKAGYSITEADLVVNRLKTHRRYRPDLMYRGFNGESLEKMLNFGTDTPDSNLIWCCDESELRNDGIASDQSAIDYAMNHPIPALAVYDGSKLTLNEDAKHEFIDPEKKLDALVAVYLLKKGLPSQPLRQ